MKVGDALTTLATGAVSALVVGCLASGEEPDESWRGSESEVCIAQSQVNLAAALHVELEQGLGGEAVDALAEAETPAELARFVAEVSQRCDACEVAQYLAAAMDPPDRQPMLGSHRVLGLDILEVSQEFRAARPAAPAPGLDDHGDSLTNLTNAIDDHGDSLTNLTNAIDDHGDSLTTLGGDGGGGGIRCRSPFAGLGLWGVPIGSCLEDDGGLPVPPADALAWPVPSCDEDL